MTNGKRIRGNPGSDPITASAGGGTPRRVQRGTRPPSYQVPGDLLKAIEVAARHRDALMRNGDILDVRGGYKFTKGRITSTAAVVVAVDKKRRDASPSQIPPSIDGVPTDVETADPYQRVAALGVAETAGLEKPRLLIDELQPGQDESLAIEEAAPAITYKPPAHLKLAPVTGAMKITCHVSPDAGWAVLKPFLEETRKAVTFGIYDFTAPHIYQTIRTLLRDSKVQWRQTIDPKVALADPDDAESTKAGDLTEESIIRGLKRVAGKRFESAFARIGSGQTFASAYHIKVAVRDGGAFWLSSGNWQSSNQPDIDFLDEDADLKLIPRYNREWHAVVENRKLAECFEQFLDFDFEAAGAELTEAAVIPMPDLVLPVDELFEEERAARNLETFRPKTFTFTKERPLSVQPILTPDNYCDVVLEVLRKKPTRTLYFQNQSLNPIASPEPAFREMMDLLAQYSNDADLDVRLIFRNIGPIRKKLESLQAAGFNMSRVRMQKGCHTKGFIIDSETVLLGSHNFTNQGVGFNRDASLLMRHRGIAKYYEAIFLHDWERLARSTIREEAVPIPVGGLTEAAMIEAGEAGRVVPWSYYEEE